MIPRTAFCASAALLVAMSTFCACNSDALAERRISSSLDSLCTSVFPAGEPGAAVLVMKGDRVLLDRGYGVATLGGAAIDGDSFLNIASCSKQFTAVAVMQLASQGLLDLDDPVSLHFPELKAEFWNTVRIRHLLSHSSGVPDARGYLDREAKINGDETLALEYLPSLDHLNFEPGSQYEYVNPTFVLLGRLVERLSGEEFTAYVREHIFTPCGMKQTLYFDRDHQDLIPNMTHGYEYADVTDMPEERTAAEHVPEQKNWYEYDFGEETFFATRPDGGIYSSTHELVEWEKALRVSLKGGESPLGNLAFRQLLQMAQSPYTPVSGSRWSDYQNRPNTFYGFGWFVEPGGPECGDVIYHTGDNGGYKALIARYPDQDGLVVILANRADWDRNALKLRIESIAGFRR